MKNVIAILALVTTAPAAQAVHMYADYNCSAGRLALIYDGPGSNYAFGGYSHFYVDGREKGLLSYQETEGDSESIGSFIGDYGPVEVIFSTVAERQVTEVKTDVVDPKTCEDYVYEHSEWKSFRTIKIEDVSEAASRVLGLKVGDQFDMNCDETMDEPVRCDNDTD